jgi:myo-inositol 2-dehydrogenase/D-chiro-inositol 1-dehydrogenase
MSTNENQFALPTTRRDFLKTSAMIGGVIAAPAILSHKSFGAGGDEVLKIGLIGCGGRGTGAAGNALQADKNVVLTAMADVFEAPLKLSLNELEKDFPNKVKVDQGHQFVGLDAYQKVIDSGVDVVLLTTPPGFRPQHLAAAVAAGKHIFCEKPVATDAPGIRSVLKSVEEAKRKKLALVAGFCWRYALPEQALFQRILAGEIGDVRAFYGTYYASPVKPMPPESERKPGMMDLEWQLRNWYNFNWLSGDSLVEQAIHAVDWMCWAMKDVPPLKAVAVGGRQIPSPGGNIYDHFEVNYEYANGARGFIGSRQQSECYTNNSATIYGSKGTGHELAFGGVPFIKGAAEWHYEKTRHEVPDMYDLEHNELFASIRRGEPINDGVRLAHSTMVGIMGRMAAYTGQEITWNKALNSREELVPANIKWDMPLATVPMAMPGKTKFV